MGDDRRRCATLGKTILLTTHYLDEAERLSDRVAVLRDGEIVAIGPPAELTAALPATEIRYRRDGEEVVLQTEEPTRVLHELTRKRSRPGRELEGLEVRRASLEDVYLALTGAGAGVRLFLHELSGELRLYSRSRELAFFTFMLPIIFFVLLGSVYGDDDTINGVPRRRLPADRDARLRRCRDRLRRTRDRARHPARDGVLKRLRATPLPAPVYIAAVLLHDADRLRRRGRRPRRARHGAFGASFPKLRLLVAALLLGGVAFAALGVGMTGLIRRAEGHRRSINAIYLPMAFISGAFFSQQHFPGCSRRSRTSCR